MIMALEIDKLIDYLDQSGLLKLAWVYGVFYILTYIIAAIIAIYIIWITIKHFKHMGNKNIY